MQSGFTFTDEEASAIAFAESFEAAAQVAVAALARIREAGGEIAQICGPISTGGLGSRELNMQRFRNAIACALSAGRVLFDQRPFEDAIARLSPDHSAENYDARILEEFYRAVFTSGHITRILLLPDWESSHGARWERSLAVELGITIEDYPIEWLLEVS
ncbi:MAG: hypothetical protein AAB901_01970 [Patescibacteria group bacterium]